MEKKGHDFALNGKYCAENPLAVVQASGEDALAFLQGQVSQDLSGLRDGTSAYGFFLNLKGRVGGDVFVVRANESNGLMVSWSMAGVALIDRLEAYIIADDVTLVDQTHRWRGWRVGRAEHAAGPAGDMAERRLALRVAGLPWAHLLVRDTDEAAPPGGGEAVPMTVFERARIDLGWPWVPVDLGSADFPQEGGRHQAGVSFTKGCYLGQEVMARLATTGRLRRGLARVGGVGPAPAGEVALMQGRRMVGELRSRITTEENGWIGLAMMQLAHFDAAQPVVTGAEETVEFRGWVTD